MIKFITPLLLAAAMFSLSSCTQDFEPVVGENAEEKVVQKKEDNLTAKELVFDEQTQQWLTAQNDPYELKNFQKAYKNLLKGQRKAPLSEHQINIFKEAAKAPKKLAATHRVLKVWPKSGAEVRDLETDLELTTSYIPFNYVVAVDKELTAQAAKSKTLPSEIRYHETIEGMRTVEGELPAQTRALPRLYVVWPIGKPYPAEMDFEEVYDVFLPTAAEVVRQKASQKEEAKAKRLARIAALEKEGRGMLIKNTELATAAVKKTPGENLGASEQAVRAVELSEMGMSALEREAIEIALRGDVDSTLVLNPSSFVPILPDHGDHDEPGTNCGHNPYCPSLNHPGMTHKEWVEGKAFLKGRLQHWDNIAMSKMSLGRVTVLVKLGSSIRSECVSDNYGDFSIQPYWADATVSLDFRNEYFRVFRDNVPHSVSLGTMRQLQEKYGATALASIVLEDDPQNPVYETYRAAEFYYWGHHYILRGIVDGGLNIWTSSYAHPDYWGVFSYGLDFGHSIPPEITIYNHNRNKPGWLLGTVFHELGHLTHYCMKGGLYTPLASTSTLIKESWADFAGWDMGEAYYGLREHNKFGFPSLTGVDEQDWIFNRTYKEAYSPLFIDLIDDYNQWKGMGQTGHYPKDDIYLGYSESGWAIIEDLAKNAATFDEFRTILEGYIGTTHITYDPSVGEMTYVFTQRDCTQYFNSFLYGN